jgi:hypothetical protein
MSASVRPPFNSPVLRCLTQRRRSRVLSLAGPSLYHAPDTPGLLLPSTVHHPPLLLYPAASFKKHRPSSSQVFLPVPFSPPPKSRTTPSCSSFASRLSPVTGEPPLRQNHVKHHCQPPSSVSFVHATFSSSDGLRLTFPSPLRCCRRFHRRLRSPELPPPLECHNHRLLHPPHRRQPSPVSLRHPSLLGGFSVAAPCSSHRPRYTSLVVVSEPLVPPRPP